VCRSTCCVKSSRCETPQTPHQHTAARRDHITPVLRQVHWLPVQRRVKFKTACLVHQSLSSTRQRTCLPTFDSSPSMVVLISVHLLTEHWLFHGRAPASGTEVSLLRDRACGTLSSTLRQMTPAGQFKRHLKAHLFRAQESRRIVYTFDVLRHTNTLTYLLFVVRNHAKHTRALEECSRPLSRIHG